MDLYDYVDAITRHWGLVLGVPLLAVVIAVVVNLLITPTYEAMAILSVPQLSSSISCASLVKSSEVEAQVIDALKASLPLEEQAPGRVIGGVEVTEARNMIRITVRSDTAKKAALIANAWADLSIEQVSEARSIEEQQLETAKQNLEAANEALRAFEKEHSTAEEELQADRERLEGYKSEQERIKQSIVEARTFRGTTKGGSTGPSVEAISTLVVNLLQKVIRESEDSAFQLQVLLMEQQADQEVLKRYETTMEGIEEALQRARHLRETVQQGGSISSPELISTLITDMLESGSMGSGMGPGFQAPSLPMQDLSPSQQMGILNTIIAILESRKRLTTTGMNQLSVKTLETLDAMISALETEEGALATRIEQLSADVSEREKSLAGKRPELEKLIEARDEAEETYTSLTDKMKQTEFVVEPKVITSAAEPREPIRPNKVRNIAIAGVSGLMVGILAAFKAEHSRRRKLGGLEEIETGRHWAEW